MGMEGYKTVTVHKDTYEALEMIRDEYGYRSLHAFIAAACLRRDYDEDRLPNPVKKRLKEVAG